MNTQRPEWNDANNALVGQGLSMVTLYYLRRYVRFLQALLEAETAPVELSTEVGLWLRETAEALRRFRDVLARGPITGEQRLELLTALGEASGRYREAIYRSGGMSGKGTVPPELARELLADALAALDQSIQGNRREDGLYHAYNLLEHRPGRIEMRPPLRDAGGTGRGVEFRGDPAGRSGGSPGVALRQRPVSTGPAELHALSGSEAPRLPGEEPDSRRGGDFDPAAAIPHGRGQRADRGS